MFRLLSSKANLISSCNSSTLKLAKNEAFRFIHSIEERTPLNVSTATTGTVEEDDFAALKLKSDLFGIGKLEFPQVIPGGYMNSPNVPKMEKEDVEAIFKLYEGQINEAYDKQVRKSLITLSAGDFAAWWKLFPPCDLHWLFLDITRLGIFFTEETAPVLDFIPSLVQWPAPPAGTIMVNVDAARTLPTEEDCFYTSLVERDHTGKLLFPDVRTAEGCSDSNVAEYIAILRGLERGTKFHKRVVVPSDNLWAVMALNDPIKSMKKRRSNASVDDMGIYGLQDQIWALQRKSSSRIMHIYREQNRVADFLAYGFADERYYCSGPYYEKLAELLEEDRGGRKFMREKEFQRFLERYEKRKRVEGMRKGRGSRG